MIRAAIRDWMRCKDVVFYFITGRMWIHHVNVYVCISMIPRTRFLVMIVFANMIASTRNCVAHNDFWTW